MQDSPEIDQALIIVETGPYSNAGGFSRKHAAGKQIPARGSDT
jgi:hypothetical protein